MHANKANELSQVKQELQSFKVTNQELLQKIRKLETYKTTFAKNDSSCRNPEIKPFSCKYCDESFVQVHEVKEHIMIHTSNLENDDGVTILSYDKDDHSNTYSENS